MFAVNERLQIGIEVNPLAEDVGPLVNWRIVDETRRRPALILGTSSDRIGTPTGRAYYGTLSKDLQNWTGLPIAPYAGAAFGEFEDEWRFIGGMRIRWGSWFDSTHLWDGVNLHHMADRAFTDWLRLGALLVEQEGDYYFGLRVGTAF